MRARARLSSLLGMLLALLALGCLAPPSLPPLRDGGARDAGHDAWLPSFAVLGVSVRDARDHFWPADAAPRRPTILIELASPPADPSQIALLDGEADADLLDDLEAPPLRASTLARALPVTRTIEGSIVRLTPLAPLAPGAHVVVTVPRFLADANEHRLPEAFTLDVVVSREPEAGAQATATWPPDGAFEVAPELALAAVRFDGAVTAPTSAVALTATSGRVVSTTNEIATCASIGWPDGVCVTLVPVSPLAPGASYAVGTAGGARDATGAPIPALEARFTTGALGTAPLEWTMPSCALGEVLDEASRACTRSDDEAIVVHGQLSAAARVTWRAESIHGQLVASRGTVALRIDGLAPSLRLPLEIDAIDYAGRASSIALPVTTTEPLATLSITEVRADPAGPEPRQEYVEVLNYGTLPVSLAGFSLADGPAVMGDPLPPVSIPAGARALIVASGFDPDDTAGGADAPVPAGALLVRLDASIATGGLSNGGEPLFLRDELSRWISAAPATPPPREGVCVVRTATSPRVGEPGSFDYDARLTCTPGR